QGGVLGGCLRLGASDRPDRKVGGVRVQGLADTCTVGTEEYGSAHTVDGSGNQLVHLGPLEQTSGDPHHGVEGVQRCGGGVRVGGLGVVHVVHTGDRGHVLNTVRFRGKGRKTGPDRLRGDPDGTRQCGGGKGVGHIVRGGRTYIGQCRQFFGTAGRVGHERAIDQQVLHHPEFTGAGGVRTQSHQGGVGVAVLLGQPCRPVVGGVDHADRVAGEDLALGVGVGGQATVPVQVVGGHVEHHGGVWTHGGGPVQLEAGQFDRQDVVSSSVGVGQGRLDDGGADVAHGQGVPAVRAQHLLQHPYRGGPAVGAGDRQPHLVGGFEPPGQLDVTDDLHARLGGPYQQWRVGAPTRRGDHQVTALGQRGPSQNDLCTCLGEFGGHGADRVVVTA